MIHKSQFKKIHIKKNTVQKHTGLKIPWFIRGFWGMVTEMMNYES